MTTKRRIPPALGAALALLLVACGPRFAPSAEPQISESAAPTFAPTQPGATQPGVAPTTKTVTRVLKGRGATVTGKVIKVGGLFPLSGGLSALGTPAYQGAQAYFNYINEHGGVFGKKFEFHPCDDQATDTQSTTCAKKLVEDDGVFIMGPSFTPFSLTVIGTLEKSGVPWVGFDGINIEGFQASNVVTIGAPIEAMAHALLPYWYHDVEKKTGSAPKKIGAVVLDVAPAQTYLREARDVICPKLGCQLVPKGGHPVNYQTTQYGTICNSLQNDRVDAVWVITDPASAIKLLSECHAVGYKPPKGFLGQHGIYLDLTLQQSGVVADQMLANSAILPPTANTPATQELQKIVHRYYPDASLGYFTALAYASARMVVDLVSKVLSDGKTLSRANLLAAANATTHYACNGLCKDVNLKPPAAATGGNHSVWIVRADFSSGQGVWKNEFGPIDAFQSETWPCKGRPKPC